MNQYGLKKCSIFYVMLDVIIILCSYTMAWYVRIGNPWYGVTEHNRQMMAATYISAIVFIVPIYLILYTFFNLYSSKSFSEKWVELVNIFKANLFGLLLLALALFLGSKNILINNFSRSMIFLFTFFNFLVEITARNAFRVVLQYIYLKDKKDVLLIGYSQMTETFIDRINYNSEYHMVGILDDNGKKGKEYKGVPVIGSFSELSVVLGKYTVDEIIIILDVGKYAQFKKIITICEKTGVQIKLIPDCGNMIPTIPHLEDLEGMPLISVNYSPLTDAGGKAVKRLFDVAGAVVSIIIFSPIMIVTSVILKLTSSEPIIFKQERVGLNNQPFVMYKFRSMKVQKGSGEENKWTIQNDIRVTPFGRFIRKTSIDEMPQLFNVLKGDMSLIGPRPERRFYVEKFKDEVPDYMIKHQVRPGMTGWAQVNGYRGDTSIIKRIEFDLYYIENWTLELDFKILLLTVFKGFVNKNAY